MITGMYQSTLGVHNHRSQMDSGKGEASPPYHASYRLPIKILPELFKQAGYHTALNSGANRDGKKGKTDYNFIWHSFQYDSPHWLDCPKEKPFFAQLQLKGGKNRGNDTGNVDPQKMTLPPYYPDTPVLKEDWAQYMNSWIKVDDQVGQVLKQLQTSGRLENTAIFFMTDHGVSHLRGKQFLYEEGIRVPLLVRLPESQSAGTTRVDLVTQIDVSAASLALAGIELPSNIQGRNFLAENYQPNSAVFSARDRCDETVEIIRSVRTARYKYIRNFMSHLPHMQPNQYKDGKTITKTMRRLHADGQLDELQARIFQPSRPREELYDHMVSDPVAAVRVAAALALARMDKSSEGIPVLLTTIEDDNWLAGLYAIRALEWSQVRTPEAHVAVKRALNNPYEFTRRIAKRLASQW